MTIQLHELKELFQILLERHNIDVTDEYDEFIRCVKVSLPLGSRIINIDNLNEGEIDLPVGLSIEFGDDALVYYNLFDVHDVGVIDIYEDALTDVKTIVLRKRNINKLIKKL